MPAKKLKVNTEISAVEDVEQVENSIGSAKGSYDGTRIVSFEQDDNTAKVQIKKANEIPASLILLAGPGQLIGHSWSLDEALVTIGRSYRLSNVTIPEGSMSKTHFQIQSEEDGVFVIDLKSTNKTYLNNESLTPYKKYRLENNSQVRAGNVILKFLEKGALELFSNKSILDRSHTDSLTGLLNRAALKIRAKEFFDSGKNFCVITFDIDHFKEVNDTFGHLAGDFILEQISKQIHKIVREGDQAFRYGGEEFCVFTYNNFEVAENIAERIRVQIEKYKFIFKENPIQITISLGVASAKKTDKDWKDVYDRADSYLYKAKNSGRNKVVARKD